MPFGPLSDGWAPMSSLDLSQDAAFDTLYIVTAGARRGVELFSTEVQAFAYLACLLSLFDGRPGSRWGYGFIAVPPLQPFSREVDFALSRLSTAGFVGTIESAWTTTESGDAELEIWRSLSRFRPRQRWLQPAVEATALHSLASITNRLSREPGIAAATNLHEARDLLEEGGLGGLHE